MNPPTELQLSQIPLFKSLPEADLLSMKEKFQTWKAPVGTLILEEGKIGDEFFIILEGRVEIVRALGSPEESHLGVRGAGEFIGEIGLLNQGAARTATARAVEDTRLMVVTFDQFSELLQKHPKLAYEMASVLSARITEALNETIRNLHNKNQKLEQAYNELKDAQEQIVEKEKLEHSLNVAREIQYSILPVEIPTLPGYDIGALMSPAQAVGGDFYGVYALDETHMALIVGDVADKGMPAAIFMAQTHALLRASIDKQASPSKVLQRVNELMLEMNARSLFATVVYGILNGATGEFHYVRAGHELPMIVTADGQVILPERGKGQALGVLDEPRLEESSLIIPQGGMLLLYSDGVTDDRDISGKTFDQAGLLRAVDRTGLKPSAQEICQAIYDALVTFRGGASQFDDVTLMAAKRL